MKIQCFVGFNLVIYCVGMFSFVQNKYLETLIFGKGNLDIGRTDNGIGRLDSNTPRKYRKPLVKYDDRAEIICDKKGVTAV